MIAALRRHWPEYLMEAAGLGLFMISAGTFGVLLEFPGSPIHHAIASPVVRRVLMGLAMGGTAAAIVYSPWGKRSGAHLNPAVTLTFLRLGKIEPADALWYVGFQLLGGIAGMAVAVSLLTSRLASPSVNFVVTVPGPWGLPAAFLAETAISFLLMLAVLYASNERRLNRFTGIIAGALVALYISVEAPVSGMSMNPARTLASAWSADLWTGFWIYLTAPPLAMLAAAQAYASFRGRTAVRCAKLHHENEQRCIFRCSYFTHPQPRSDHEHRDTPQEMQVPAHLAAGTQEGG